MLCCAPFLTSKRSVSTSLQYRSATIHRARHTTCVVTLAVTLGLPSRSPPIQLPNLWGVDAAVDA